MPNMLAGARIVCLIRGFLLSLLLSLDLVSTSESDKEMGVQEFCETELFNATCGSSEVILMTHAQYGRMRMGRCVKLDYGHMGCASDVIEHTDGRCSGKRQCEIRIPDAQLAGTLPCPDDLKPYMEASFRCVKVHTPPLGDMCTPRDLIVTGTRGYLSNTITQETGCGGMLRPWVVKVKKGQHIRVILYDFAVSKRREGVYQYAHCQIYGEIKEQLSTGLRNITVCGATKREHKIYTSITNSVNISFKSSDEDSAIMPFFMFKFEAIGCPDKKGPPGSHSIRQGDDRLLIRCNFTKDVFHLKCVDNKWEGNLRNCSKSSTSRKIDTTHGDDLGIPYGLSILIVLAIALVIGLFVLFIGLAFLKNRQRGLCLFNNPRQNNARAASVDDVYDKQYVRSPWIHAREDGSATIASVGSTKTSPWSRDGTLGHAPSLVSDLPPCTPLVDRGHRPPSYGQVPGQRPRLACGCFIDGNPPGPGDLCDYPSRHEILATTCPGTCPGNCTPPNPNNRTLNPDRLILKPGDRAQFFVVDAAPIYTVRSDANNPRMANGPKSPSAKTQTGVHMQTDDVKLKKLKVDNPQCGCSDDCDKHDECPESRPLIQNESPQRIPPPVARRQSSDNPGNCNTSCSLNNETET